MSLGCAEKSRPASWPAEKYPGFELSCRFSVQTKYNVDPSRHWIRVALEGSSSNRSAIGARVEVQWEGKTQVQEVSGGNGFSSQNDRRLHFGLGSATKVDRIIIRWPSGKVQTLENVSSEFFMFMKEPE